MAEMPRAGRSRDAEGSRVPERGFWSRTLAGGDAEQSLDRQSCTAVPCCDFPIAKQQQGLSSVDDGSPSPSACGDPGLGRKGSTHRDPVPFPRRQQDEGRAAAWDQLQGDLQDLGTNQAVAPSSTYNTQN